MPTEKEREVLASFKGTGKGKRGRVGAHDSRQAKAGRDSQPAGECPVCRTWVELDEFGKRRMFLRRQIFELQERGSRAARNWLETTWGLKLVPPTRAGGLASMGLGRIHQTGISRAQRAAYAKAREGKHPVHMIVAWNHAPSFGENYFMCPIGELFAVMRGLMDDSPEFAARMFREYQASLKGASSRPFVVGDGRNGLGPIVDDATAFRV